MQLLQTTPNSWKNDLPDINENIHNLAFQDHHLIRKRHICFLNRLSSKKKKQFYYLSKRRNKFIKTIIKRRSMITILTGKKNLLIAMHCHKRQKTMCFSV